MNIFKNILSKKEDKNLESDKYKFFYNPEKNGCVDVVRFYEDSIPEPYFNDGFTCIIKIEVKIKGVWKLLYHNERREIVDCIGMGSNESSEIIKECSYDISMEEIKVIYDLIKNDAQVLNVFVKYLAAINFNWNIIKDQILNSEKTNIVGIDSNIPKVKDDLDNLKNNGDNIKIFKVQHVEDSVISEVGILLKSELMVMDGKNDITKLAIKTKDGKWKLLYHHEKGWYEDYMGVGSSDSWDETKHRQTLSNSDLDLVLSAVKDDQDALEIVKKYIKDSHIITGPNPEQNEFSSFTNNDVEEETKKR